MPIICPISFSRLHEDDMRDLDYRVMGKAFEIHRRLGSLCDTAAFRMTTFQKPSIQNYEVALHKLLLPSPLKDIHWVNIAHHEIMFMTISR